MSFTLDDDTLVSVFKEKLEFIKDVRLMYNILDVLSLKGCIDLHQKLYAIIRTECKKEDIQERKFLSLLWDSRRLSHSLCISPICNELLHNLSNVCDEEVNRVDFWTGLLESSSLVGFKQVYSYLFTNTPSQCEKSSSSDADFTAGCLHYDLCEKHVATGDLIEALSQAEKAYRLRTKLFQENFSDIYNMLEKKFVDIDAWSSNGDLQKEKRKKRKKGKFSLSPNQIREQRKHSKMKGDRKDIYLTPWKVLQCYLESTLQVGTIHEIIGNGVEAEEYLVRGKNISKKQNLALFIIAFSSLLGKLYRKKQWWNHSDCELQEAEAKLDKTAFSCCVNCRLMLQVSVEIQRADLLRSRVFHETRNASVHTLSPAESLYQLSYSKLKSEWRCSHLQEIEDGPTNVSSGSRQPGMVMGRAVSRREKSQKVDLDCGNCDGRRCWCCLLLYAKESGSLVNYTSIIWEHLRRQLCLKILSGRAKCVIDDKIHDPNENIRERIFVLVGASPFAQTLSSESLTNLLDFVVREVSNDGFAIDRAYFIYSICWFAVKYYKSRSIVQLENVIPYLKQAFVRCREVPVLLQKVSRLLSIIYVLSPATKLFSPSQCEVLSEGHWASYFHQASVGAHFTNQMIYNGPKLSSSTLKGDESCILPRRVEDMEKAVKQFFSNIPSATIVCISMIEPWFEALLSVSLGCSPDSDSWILLSRFNFNCSPLVILIPVNKVEVAADNSSVANPGKPWECPWQYSVMDEVVQPFRDIMEKNYQLSLLEVGHHSWRKKNRDLDSQLRRLLRELEFAWFGHCAYILVGELSKCDNIESVLNKLMRDLKSDCKMDVSESMLRVILGRGNCAPGGKARNAILFFFWSRNNCHIGTFGRRENEMCKTTVRKLLDEAASELKTDFVNRKPVILVLDNEVQMLPWESFPVLRKQEVYRMPSVGSILVRFNTKFKNQYQDGSIVAAFPLIDPLHAFYVLNPGVDRKEIEEILKDLFIDQKLQGKAGCPPTVAELSMALEAKDLYYYVGHGSGSRYIPDREIQQLDNCASATLIGCSSGVVQLNGQYAPNGTPHAYILGGAEFVVANLWDVICYDICDFTEALLTSLFKERSYASAHDCDECKSGQLFAGGCVCNEKTKIGTLICDARIACSQTYITGAAPVCYGVPTGLVRKDCCIDELASLLSEHQF